MQRIWLHTACSPVYRITERSFQRTEYPPLPDAECLSLLHPSALLLRFLCSTHLESDLHIIYLYASSAAAAVPAMALHFISMLFAPQKFPDADEVIIDRDEEVVFRLSDRDLVLSLQLNVLNL